VTADPGPKELVHLNHHHIENDQPLPQEGHKPLG
jgi:hypothetical protein